MMPNDEERRYVARKLRLGGRPSLVKLMAYTHSSGDKLFERLADLIEPSDPTGRGIDSVYDWCWERLEGADGAEDELYCSIMRAIEDYRHPERATAHTVRAVDRDALLALAKGLDSKADDIIRAAQHARFSKLGPTMGEAKHDSHEWRCIASHIREALGVKQ